MKRFLLLLLAMIVPGLAQSQAVCTFNDGYSTWGPIGVVGGAGAVCVPPGAISGDDVVIVAGGLDPGVDSAIVTIIDDITFTTPSADNGIQVESGGSLIIDARGADEELEIILTEGTTSGILDDVGLYAAPGSTIDFTGGCRQNGVDIPQLVTCDDEDYTDQTWVVDQIGVCTGVGAGPAHIGTCSGGTEDFICLHWSNARNNPEDGGADGDTYIEEALTEIDVGDDRIRFISGMEAPWSYEIYSVDSDPTGVDGDGYELCFDVTRSYDTEATIDYPASMRDNDTHAVGQSFGKGATCVWTSTTVPGLTTDGDYVGRCIRFCTTAGADCDTQPYKIAKTVNDADCSGPQVGRDAIYLTDLNPLEEDLITAQDFTIDYCVSTGDQFIVEAPVRFTDGTPGDDIDGKIVMRSTDITIEHTLLSGPATVDFDAAGFVSVHHLDIADSGDATNGFPGLHIENMVNADIPYLTMSGGDGSTGGAAMLYYEDVSGVARVSNGGFRYAGDSFITTSADDSGQLYVENAKFEHISHAGAADLGIMEDSTAFSRTEFRNILCTDCTSGADGVIITSAITNPVYIYGIVVWGIPEGGLGGEVAGATIDVGATYRNMLAREIVCTHGKSTTCLPTTISNCDIRNIETSDPAYSFGLNTRTGGEFSNCILANPSTAHNTMLSVVEAGGAPGTIISNVILWNPLTTDPCGAGACQVIGLTFDGLATTTSTVENLTIGWPEGTASDWDTAIEIGAPGGDTGLNMGSIYVTGQEAGAAAAVHGIDVEALAIVLDGVGDAGSFCVHDGENTVGAYTYVDSIASYTPVPLLGVAPEFIDPAGGNYVLKAESRIAQEECGAKTGAERPGMTENGNDWLYEAVGVDPPGAVISEPRTY